MVHSLLFWEASNRLQEHQYQVALDANEGYLLSGELSQAAFGCGRELSGHFCRFLHSHSIINLGAEAALRLGDAAGDPFLRIL